jgi:hypothetical protein
MNVPRPFSVVWTQIPNANGTNPPNPKFEPFDPTTPMTPVSDYLPVGAIQSRREPYAVEWYWGKYGSLNTKLGTNMGK